MADILRRVACLSIKHSANGNLRTLLPMQVRSIFSSAGVGIDGFKLSREQHAARYAPSIDAFKKRFAESVEQPTANIFTEDLRNAIISANNDQEIDNVIKALKKYNTSKEKLSDFHFGSPVMRLLYVHNKTDLALQLFMDESLKEIFNDSASALVLMNKLIEDKRYDDVVKVFEHGAKRGYTTANGRKYPTDVTMLAMESLYQQNTKESLQKAKELVGKVKEGDSDLNPRGASMTALLAIQQGEPGFAMEVIGAVRVQTMMAVQNIRAICYADMGRLEEAINVVQLISDPVKNPNDRRRIFPLTMRHIRLAVEKNKDQALLGRLEDLSKTILKNNRLSAIDLPEFLGQPINRRSANRKGTQANFGRNQFDRNQQRFGQQSYNQRQGALGGFNRQSTGFNRENRFGSGYNNQSGRFGNNNFQRINNDNDRRSQNSYVDGYRRDYDNDRSFKRNRSDTSNDFKREENRGASTTKRSLNKWSSEASMDREAWTAADNDDTAQSIRNEKDSKPGKRNRNNPVTDESSPRKTSTWQREEDKDESIRQ